MKRMNIRRKTQSDKGNYGDSHITITEAMGILNLGRDAIRSHIANGTIKGFKHGGKWYVSRKGVEARKRVYDFRKK